MAHHAHQAQFVQQANAALQGHGHDLMMMDHGDNGNQPNQAAANLILEHRRLAREYRNHASNEEVCEQYEKA